MNKQDPTPQPYFIKIEIEPVAASRPRVTRWGTYTPPKYKKYKNELGERFREIISQEIDWESYFVDMTFYVPIPKYRAKKIKEGDYCHKKPDLDNYVKGLFDAICEKDSLICSFKAVKRYSHEPRIEIRLMPLAD